MPRSNLANCLLADELARLQSDRAKPVKEGNRRFTEWALRARQARLRSDRAKHHGFIKAPLYTGRGNSNGKGKK